MSKPWGTKQLPTYIDYDSLRRYDLSDLVSSFISSQRVLALSTFHFVPYYVPAIITSLNFLSNFLTLEECSLLSVKHSATMFWHSKSQESEWLGPRQNPQVGDSSLPSALFPFAYQLTPKKCSECNLNFLWSRWVPGVSQEPTLSMQRCHLIIFQFLQFYLEVMLSMQI